MSLQRHELSNGTTPLRKLLEAVARKHGTTVATMLAQGRGSQEAWLVNARREAIHELRRQYPALSLPAIGRIVGRNHTTVLHLLRQPVQPVLRETDFNAPMSADIFAEGYADESGIWAI